MPRPLPPAGDARYQNWLRAFTAWVDRKAQLETDVALEGVDLDAVRSNRPSCTPKADYQWRDIPVRRSRATTPARSSVIGRPKTLPDTPEVERRRQTFRESKARRAALIREGLNSRKDAA